MRKLLLSLFAAMTASFAMGQTNLLTNPSFEEWTDDVTPVSWKTTSSAGNAELAKSTDAKSGSFSVEVKGKSGSNVRLGHAEIALKAGTYTCTLYAKAAEDGAQARLGHVVVTDGKPGSYKYAGDGPTVLSTSEWTELTQEFTLEAASTVSIVLMNSKNGNGVSVLADDASLTTTDGGLDDGEGGEGGETVSIANTPETAYTVTKALEIIAAGQDLGTKVYVAGTVKGTPEISTQYGNASYVITDGTSDLTVYRGLYLGNVKFENEDQLQDGDEVIVFGKLKLYQKEGQDDLPEFDQGNYIYSLNGQTKEEEVIDYTKVEAISIADFLQKADTKTMYKLTGVVRNIINTTYGNFDLCDKDNEETKIYIYGVVKQDDTSNNKIWESLGVQEGDILTIVGTYTTYNEAPQIVKAVYISHQAGGEPQVDITNTPETAYTTSQAKDLIDAGKGLSTKVYVKGNITKIGIEGKDGNLTDLPGNQYGNATYFISDGNFELEVYRGYYINNEKFTAEDQIKVGDEVIVYGQLTMYKETYEFTTGSYIYSLNGVTDGISSINTNDAQNNVIYDLSGRRVEKAVKGLYIVNGKKVVIK